MLKDPKVFKFYTGFTEEQFYCLLEFLIDGMDNLTYWGTSSASNSNSIDLGDLKPEPLRKLTSEDELLLVLTRLRGMLEQDLAVRFELSQSHLSRTITTWINAMYHRFKETYIWSTREQSRGNLPEKVKEFCPTLRCIIDATEIYIEQPKTLRLSSLLFLGTKVRL